MFRKSIYILLSLSAFIYSCDIGDNEADPSDSFTRIFNNSDFGGAFRPLDIKQTSDSGFIVLGATNSAAAASNSFDRPYVLKADRFGEFEWARTADEPFVNPVSSLIEIGGEFFFVSMDEISLFAHLMKIDLETRRVFSDQTYANITYPLAASQSGKDNGFFIMGYDRNDLSTIMNRFNSDFSSAWNEPAEYSVFEDVEESIVSHLLRRQPLPFFTGELVDSDVLFFNGFRNFNFSFNFINASTGERIGGVNGIQDDSGISAATHLGGSDLALSRFSFGDNFILPRRDVNPLGNAESSDLGGNPFPELNDNANVVVKTLEINGSEYTLYATDTRSGQIILIAYDTSGQLIGTTFLGRINPVEIGNFITTGDGGLAVLGTVYVAGRFPRITIFKFSAEELNDILGI
ncbi:MAG: hypothetical protein AAFX87_04460 [Bacteroidota bacterium]